MKDENEAEAGEAISVLAYDEYEVDRGIVDARRLVRELVDVQKLEDEIRSFLTSMEKILQNASKTVGAFRLDTVSVSAEVNAKGKLSLLGTGGEMGGKSGLSFTFKRT